jgi:transcriptional regulator NrdR family protein
MEFVVILCPKCDARMGVKETKQHKHGVLRRKYCPNCGARVVTVESVMEVLAKRESVDERIERFVPALEQAWLLMKR